VRRLVVGGGSSAAVSGRHVALRIAIALAIAVMGLVLWAAAGGTHDAGARALPRVAALDTMPVPEPPDETAYIKDKTAAVKLGKALFWDMQAGSDGRTACATCHYNAGADNRSRNQINPRQAAGVEPTFDGKGPNEQLTADDFPFHKLANPNDRASQVMSDTANVAGSQGVKPSVFDGVTPGEPADDQHVLGPDGLFSIGGTDVRRTTGRNTPSVINAVFNFRNFWDGRAQNDFNGVDPFGSRNTGARVGKVDPATGQVEKVQVDIQNSSLASQAVGPPGNSVEMSADGRTLSDIGTKLLSLRPLRTQIVDPKDSVLGDDVDASGRGIGTSYEDLIKQAFQPDWWNSDASVTGPKNQDYSLMAFNFPLFWGLAIQSYEATLVSDQTPADRFFKGDPNALSPAAQRGLNVFQTTGKCTECHNGPALTEATTLDIAGEGTIELDKAGRWIDSGFLNIGVRPTADDPGIGGSDGTAAANPLSVAKWTDQNPLAVDGAFKIPGLRNVELTAPYFHNGGEMTLRQVVDFYSRGGDFDNAEKASDIEQLNLSEQDKDDLVEFLKSLTDPRVKLQSAPFDHPELYVPVGEKTDANGNIVTENGVAADCFRQVPATGAGGGVPLTPFPDFTGPACDDAPDLHNPAPVPHRAPAGAPAAAAPAPAASGGGGAPASQSVAGVAGQSARCVVPRLRGRTVAQARRLLSRSKCSLGLVVAPRKARGRMVVSSQRPAAGMRRPTGTRVAVRLRRSAKR
jgi:cytochrome c peroxidase